MITRTVLLLSLLFSVSCGNVDNDQAVGGQEESTLASDKTAKKRVKKEWKYKCEATVLEGYVWKYQGKINHDDLKKQPKYICVDPDRIGYTCKKVQTGVIFGVERKCGFFNRGEIAYTWHLIGG